ncbi:hypothetical protein P872_15715 [Rhodonellum psychrophilum GCM71 = DSM 17998]|uniref:Uncharacterized protein n=1 Tax=Rhodonellum psychrophilum GCM71 = DSM 17998 TaxID=1123057 RepID=U5C2D6_9BACT|nr:hypothetical protein P872_15715 [Rhodonellum psychrophilum GCM71 = DSM 17998]
MQNPIVGKKLYILFYLITQCKSLIFKFSTYLKTISWNKPNIFFRGQAKA